MSANNSTLLDELPVQCSMGTVVPFVNEDGWSVGLRATLYFIALLYSFLGAAIVNEYVMSSASVITSTRKHIYLSKTPDAEPNKDGDLDMIEVRVWHETILNLALMAFCTSATEILICAVEIIGSHFDHGELGPGVIVGSAAFNVLVVTAICMVSPPGNETRKIEELQVYYVSVIFSLAGYSWIIILLHHASPDVITLSESILTVMMFPVFIFLVWLSHHDWWGCCAQVFRRKKPIIQHHKSVDEVKMLDEELLKDGKLDRENLAKLVHKLKRHSSLNERDAATVATFKLLQNQPHSTIWYRIGGIRSLTAGYRNMPGLEARLRRAYREICVDNKSDGADGTMSWKSTKRSITKGSTPQSHMESLHRSSGATTMTSSPHNPNASIVEFHSAIVAVERTVGNIQVTVTRHGNLEVQAKVRLTTVDGTAKKNRDYLPIDQILVFDLGQREAYVQVIIVNISGWEEDEEFFLKLSLIHNEHEHVELGRIYMMAVTIIDGSEESIIAFQKRGQIVKESAELVTILVNRHEGAAGWVSVWWRTVDKTAVAGKDYIASTGELLFNSGEMSLYLEIPIINHMAEQKEVYFEVELYAPSGGARLGRINRCAITITNDEDLQSFIGTMASITTMNLDAIRVKKSTWARQMREALLVDGGDVDKATKLDYVAHFFSFLWKALFSLIPPPTMLGGWPCFLVSLLCLGFMTLIITDVAETFGCLVSMDETFTGISIVALGHNLPEILSAQKEIRMEKTADAAMIGTAGRMAANMMLGLGLPWLIATIYHEMKGTAFIVIDPDIGPNMATFMVSAFLAQSLLIIRRLARFLGKAEIGGPVAWKWTTFVILILLWVSYVTFAHYFMHGQITIFE